MPTITGVKVMDTYAGIREDSGRITAALSAAELILKATADEQPNPELFDRFAEFLSYCQNASAEDAAAGAWKFIAAALGMVGFQMQTASCAICRGELSADVLFSFRHGGALCASCAARSAVDSFPVSTEALQFFSPSAQAVPLSPEARQEAKKIAEGFSTYILERELKAPQFL